MSYITRILAAIAIAAFTVGPVSAATASNAASVKVAQTAPTTATTGAVQGTVLDETGAPVAGATVTARGVASYNTTTDAKGTFSIANMAPGLYELVFSKPGYDTAREADFAVFSGEAAKLAVTMHTATLTSLRTIATVRAIGRGTFNTSTAAVNTVPAETFKDYGSPQVMRVLNQIPGTQASLPGTSANDAVPGAITFPNIRGALSFETASLIDGHPLSVGTFGDYVTTFLNAYMLGGTEIIKGPGAMAPQVNYAIGGTVNLRTKDPTATMTPDYTFGFSSHGGTYSNFGLSDTVGRWGFVADIATEDEPSAVNNYQGWYDPAQSSVLLSTGKVLSGGIPAGQSQFNLVPGTATTVKNEFGLVACCYTENGQYNNTSELVKVRYKFSGATVATVSYLGSQTFADQNGNTSSQVPLIFAPRSGSFSAVPTGLNLTNVHPGSRDIETNNEPIIQGEIRSTLGNDTVLGRFYHAGIHRLINQGGGNPNIPTIQTVNLYGTSSTGAVFNGPTSLAFYDYFQQAENDSLTGYSFQYDHPIAQNDITFAVDATNSTTTSFSFGSPVISGSTVNPAAAVVNPSVNLPTGSGQRFTTMLLRGQYQINPQLRGTLSLYDNVYNSTYPVSRVAPAAPGATTPTYWYDGTGYTFGSTTNSHFDQRLGLEWRAKNNVAVRFAAGSAIAPPYLFLLSTVPSIAYSGGTGIVTATVNGGSLKPETAFGYDLGADWRLKDGVTSISGDVYLTNLFNHFVNQVQGTSLTCTPNAPLPTLGLTCPATVPAGGAPVFTSGQNNISNARFQGLELTVRRAPAYGWGYTLEGSTQRGYVYNLPTCYYGTAVVGGVKQCAFVTNLGQVPTINFTGGALFGAPGFSNQNIPYLQGNAEFNFRWKNGAYAAFGETLYGKNNSLNEPPFGVAYLTARYPLSDKLSMQISGDNIFNAWPGLFPIQGAGIAVPLAGTPFGTTLPAAGATVGNVQGPATWRFELTKTFGAQP